MDGGEPASNAGPAVAAGVKTINLALQGEARTAR